MNIEHLNLVYQQIVNQSNIIPASEKAEKEALDKKKSILMWMGLGVTFITLLICLIPTLISDSKFLQTIMIAAIITIVVVIWKAVKMHLKKKWGIKDEK